MCHSVDMYRPEATRRAAEERILEGQAAAAAREQRVVDAVFRLAAWLSCRRARGAITIGEHAKLGGRVAATAAE